MRRNKDEEEDKVDLHMSARVVYDVVVGHVYETTLCTVKFAGNSEL